VLIEKTPAARKERGVFNGGFPKKGIGDVLIVEEIADHIIPSS
jgi:hypothetical protein